MIEHNFLTQKDNIRYAPPLPRWPQRREPENVGDTIVLIYDNIVYAYSIIIQYSYSMIMNNS